MTDASLPASYREAASVSMVAVRGGGRGLCFHSPFCLFINLFCELIESENLGIGHFLQVVIRQSPLVEYHQIGNNIFDVYCKSFIKDEIKKMAMYSPMSFCVSSPDILSYRGDVSFWPSLTNAISFNSNVRKVS